MENEKHWFIDSAYISIGNEYEKYCDKAKENNILQSIDENKFLSHAHTLLMGLIGSMLEMNENKPVPVDQNSKRKFILTAAFIQGISICEEAILSSLYLQAGNLIRQEFECLGLLREIEKGMRRNGKQVNAKNVPLGLCIRYGELSTLAHLSDHNLLESIIQYNTSWGDFSSTNPQYKSYNTKQFYGFHISMVLAFVYELRDLYSEMYGFEFEERDLGVLNSVIGILKDNETHVPTVETWPEPTKGQSGGTDE